MNGSVAAEGKWGATTHEALEGEDQEKVERDG